MHHRKLLDAEPLVRMPDVSFHLADIYQQLGVMQPNLVSLDSAVGSALNDSALYLTASDTLIQDFQRLNFDESNVAQIILTM